VKSLLEKIGASKKETRQENRLSNSPQPSPASGNQIHPGQNLSPPEDAFRWPAIQCNCGSVIAWRDVYGGGPHCHGCRPWPAESLVRAIAGWDAQDARWRVLWGKDGSDAVHDGDRASCGHSRTRRRTVWIPKDGKDRRTGKPILVVDFDRAEEAEIFDECIFCGAWIFVGMVDDF
jgi:hypothetical protein